MFNLAGHAATLNAATQMSLHSTNPGTGASPAAGELSDAPYARKACTFAAPVLNGEIAESELSADVTFDLNLTIDQDVFFVGLWAGSTYLGYIVPNNTGTFSGSNITTRRFVVQAETTMLTRTNV
ncbi:hypothetical protein [Alishewanella sp. SMS8]|uniref:hypothetical protein n=1 Tax=Alishewanella sp. SMS8 TaxID=2994676 RepID=UPI002740ACBB|nr:hypothetical protein [Alishewanella sp. SMS8]MDP5206339.1 hypothetical protein [Alishewanella sp. SMS9]MDP5459898.1 hypothetical protein [Alishewanella sp. SMS8]